MSQEYSAKERLILESVISLFMQGKHLHSMKIADIAAEAGIGKGTVYEYFSCKEEIIGKALAFRIFQELVTIKEIVSSSHHFKACMFELLERLSTCHEMDCPSFILLRPDILENSEVQAVFKTMEQSYNQIERELVHDFLQLGVEEGILSEKAVAAYGHQAVLGVFAGLYVLIFSGGVVSLEQSLENTYTILVKALS